MYGYIYKTTNLLDNTIYIGQKKSKNFIPSYTGSGIWIVNAVKKYGKNSFKVELIAEGFDFIALDILEKYYISTYKATGVKMYNIADGGKPKLYLYRKNIGQNKGVHWSAEIRKRMSDAHQGCWDRKPHPCLGTHHSEETKRKIGLKSVGRSEAIKAGLRRRKELLHVI